ncbi:glycoside hydrolase N-terminal domain-containing protein [Kitasatospora sp. NPDC048365]|uniref:glycosyl hydrolase family 95 catalytic domain-containing protein n=1 Tax=Kitasatospora sp. NPDC048365 TaxID=3364050 RepID=UPI0037217FD1
MSSPAHGLFDTAPADDWRDGYLCGNGRHGAVVHGDSVVVTHHDLVLPDPLSGVEPPLLAPRLEAMRDALLAGDQERAVRLFGGDWEPRFVQRFHPGFAVRIRRPDAAPAEGFRRTVDFATGVVAAEWTDAAGRWRSECFVSRADDVVVQRLVAPEGAGVKAEIGVDGRLPGVPEELRAAVRSVYRPAQVPAAEGGGARDEALLRLRARYPGSELGYRGAVRILAPGGAVRCDGPRVHVLGAPEVLLLTRVARGPVGPVDGDPARLDTGMYELPQGHAELLERHLAAHRPAYQRVTLDLGADPAERARPVAELLARQEADPSAVQPALLEALFAAGRYHLLSASGHRPPRLCGLWTGDWDTAWGGAFTTNANLNLQLASAAVADLPEAVHALAALVADQLPDWRTNAARLFGTRGVVAPAHTDGANGLQYHFNHSWAHHLWTAGADWLLHPLLEHAETTGEAVDWLASALGEVAEFYQDFLTRTGPDGAPVLVPSYSPENHPVDPATGAPLPGAASVNATMDLAAARHALAAAARRTADPDAAAAWRTLAERLPGYAVNADGALAEWAWPGHRDGYDHRHVSHLYPVWPLHAITPEDTPELADAARRALRLRGDENHSGHGHLHRALAAARLDEPALLARPLAHLLGDGFWYRSLMSSHYPGREAYNADVAHALPGVLIEALVRSTPEEDGRPARLVLLPAPVAGLERGVLRGVRTRFGATVEELAWDGERVSVTLRAPAERRFELRVVPGGKPAEPVRLTAGAARTLVFPLV